MLNPKVRLRVSYQDSQFWPILACFVDFYSLFWGPGVISTVNKPWVAFTCRASTLAVFVDSDMFPGLLLTLLGSQSDFHDCRTPRCAYVSVIHTRGFWPILSLFMDYYSVLGSQSDFHGCRTLGCVYLSVVNTHNFCKFWSVSWTITHRFRVPK